MGAAYTPFTKYFTARTNHIYLTETDTIQRTHQVLAMSDQRPATFLLPEE